MPETFDTLLQALEADDEAATSARTDVGVALAFAWHGYLATVHHGRAKTEQPLL